MDKDDAALLARLVILGCSVAVVVWWAALVLGLAFRLLVKAAGG